MGSGKAFEVLPEPESRSAARELAGRLLDLGELDDRPVVAHVRVLSESDLVAVMGDSGSLQISWPPGGGGIFERELSARARLIRGRTSVVVPIARVGSFLQEGDSCISDGIEVVATLVVPSGEPVVERILALAESSVNVNWSCDFPADLYAGNSGVALAMGCRGLDVGELDPSRSHVYAVVSSSSLIDERMVAEGLSERMALTMESTGYSW